jgi:hypothetical protein
MRAFRTSRFNGILAPLTNLGLLTTNVPSSPLILTAVHRSSHNSEAHIGFPPVVDPTWLVFDGDIKAALASVDPVFFSRELEAASPRGWR